jgi:hypothetical protein
VIPAEVLKIKAAVRFRDGLCCTECGMTQADHYKTYGTDLQVHRLVPGSPYSIEGSVTLCRSCHAGKGISKHGSRRAPDGRVFCVLTFPLEAQQALRAAALDEGVDMGEFVFEVLKNDSRYREALERIRRKKDRDRKKDGGGK